MLLVRSPLLLIPLLLLALLCCCCRCCSSLWCRCCCHCPVVVLVAVRGISRAFEAQFCFPRLFSRSCHVQSTCAWRLRFCYGVVFNVVTRVRHANHCARLERMFTLPHFIYSYKNGPPSACIKQLAPVRLKSIGRRQRSQFVTHAALGRLP